MVKKTCEQKRKFIEIGKGLNFTKGGVVDRFAKPSNKQRSDVTLRQSSIMSYFAGEHWGGGTFISDSSKVKPQW